MSSPSSPLTKAELIIPDFEISSFLNCENILDTKVVIEDIEGALKTLKLGKSVALTRWILNTILAVKPSSCG